MKQSRQDPSHDTAAATVPAAQQQHVCLHCLINEQNLCTTIIHSFDWHNLRTRTRKCRRKNECHVIRSVAHWILTAFAPSFMFIAREWHTVDWYNSPRKCHTNSMLYYYTTFYNWTVILGAAKLRRSFCRKLHSATPVSALSCSKMEHVTHV